MSERPGRTETTYRGLTHECDDPECHVPGFVATLNRGGRRVRLIADRDAARMAAVEVLHQPPHETVPLLCPSCGVEAPCPTLAALHPDPSETT